MMPALHQLAFDNAINSNNSQHTDPLAVFEWPAIATIESLGEAISAASGLRIVVQAIPAGMSHHEVSGLTTVVGRTAHVFYDARLSPLNREQTILHEFAHVLHGDVRGDSESTHMRSMFTDPVEARAETTGMRLLNTLHRTRRQRESEVLDFLSGGDKSSLGSR